MLSRLKHRHIQCFLEVARQRSISKAAAALSLTQPAVSKTLKELEEILDVPLMERGKRGIVLTEMGRVFLRHAGASVSALQQGLDSIAHVRMGARPSIRVGVLPTVASLLAPEAVQRYKRLVPGAIVSLVSGPNAYLLDRLRLGALDVVIGRLGPPDEMRGFSFIHLYSERVAFIVRRGHPLLRQETPFHLSAIAGFTVLIPDKEAVIRPVVENILVAHGIGDLPDRIETVSTSFGRSFTRSTDAVWIISRSVAEPDLSEGALAELPVDTRDTSGPVGLTTSAATETTGSIRLFMETVQQAAAEMLTKQLHP
ncbi:pca operon transcription factor PcaQ [Telmatospirillum sp. J64-1]|uniref:pca operon transcription factor PcaQ n=1 Tax=Telmatospirillum sp. J64-1 TaxID=2502183 RepID=UPI00115F4816|nr:pca operon transcription factor PcaQ [Telmatospirillum sp. J64-1]